MERKEEKKKDSAVNRNPEPYKPDVKPILELPEIANAEIEKIQLTENKIAYIKYPKNLNSKDTQIFKHWLEMMLIRYS